MEENSAYYAVDVEEAAARLQKSPDRVREMLATGELEGIPPGGTVSGDWRVLLPTTLRENEAPPEEESPQEHQDEAPLPDVSTQGFVEPPHSTADADEVLPATETLSRGDEAVIESETTAPSGWVSTQQAAKALGISPRTVRWHIEQGNLQAKPEGEGVKRYWLVSIDSLYTFRDARQVAGEMPRPTPGLGDNADIAPAGLGDAIRELVDRLAEEAASAAEYRVRLELTEQAQSTMRAELEEERRRREGAERERDDLRRRLEAAEEAPREAREPPVRAAPIESSPPTASAGGAQEAREATQGAAETLRVPDTRPTATGAQASPQRSPQPSSVRGRLWRMFRR